MGDPRDPEPVEPTLIPQSRPADSAAPSETPAHPGAQEGTLKSLPGLRSLPTSSSVTEADATRTPASGDNTAATASPADATQVGPTGMSAQALRSASSAGPAGQQSSPGTTGTMVGRFALKSLHARGGLGEVFTARDTELNREVALKRIQSRYADDPASRRRFLTEAELTARLDHPGVVPVYGLVADGLGRPCYAMRFIRGETLKDEIERYHHSRHSELSTGATGPDSSPDSHKPAEPPATIQNEPRSVAFRHLLQRFIAVCQAIAYAHTHKVIHRDIKPANVMVGAFGETLVVDWGLAKALDDSAVPEQLLKMAAESGYRHDPEATELPDHLTLAGTAVGTPAYMSPEQASGRIDLVGAAADIYSLGATLFAILTGKAPFAGNTTETLDRVRRGEFPGPNEINPEIPEPLDAICRKAMALAIDDRYSTPLELSADIERWLSDEPVSCYRDPLAARLARWSRRHPAWVAASISLLLAGVFAAISIAWAVNAEKGRTQSALNALADEQTETLKQRDRAFAAEKDSSEANILLKKQRDETDLERRGAIAARDQARRRYEAAVATYNTLVVDIQQRLADQVGTQEDRRKLLLAAQKGLNSLLAPSEKDDRIDTLVADRTLVSAHQQMGNVYQLLGDTQAAIGEYQKAVKTALAVLVETRKRKLTSEETAAKRDLGLSNLGLAEMQLQAGKSTAAADAGKIALHLLREIHTPGNRQSSEDLAAALDKNADLLIETGNTIEAEKQCQEAFALREKIARDAPEDWIAQQRLADSLDQFAEILLRAGNTAEARKQAEHALDARILVEKHLPGQPEAMKELAAAHSRLGEIAFDRDELAPSRTHYEQARNKLDELLTRDPRNASARLAQAHNCRRLASVALAMGDLKSAESFVDQCARLCDQLAEVDPNSTAILRERGAMYDQRGMLLLIRGKSADALTQFQQSVELLRSLQKNDPGSLHAKIALAHALEQVGTGHLAMGKATTAIEILQESAGIREKVPDSSRARRELALGLGKLAEAYRANRQIVPARETITRAVFLLRKSAAEDRSFLPAQRELAQTEGHWGDVLADDGKPTLALIAAQQSLAALQALGKADVENASIRSELAAAWSRLAAFYARFGQPERAGDAAKEALKILDSLKVDDGAVRRDKALAVVRLADSFVGNCDFEQARQKYLEASKLVSPTAEDARTVAIARLIEEKLAIVDAMTVLANDPSKSLASIPAAQRTVVALGACNWLIKSRKPISAENLALGLAAGSKDRENLYQSALVLARCALVPKITKESRERYSREAAQTLEAAIKAGFTSAQLLDLPEWDACRGMKEFEAIVSGLTASIKE